MELRNYKKSDDKQHEIIGIELESIAMELGIVKGDRLVSINNKPINDALDYHLFIKEEMIDLVIYKWEHKEAWLYEIEKDEDEDLGLIFDTNLMDEYSSCRNKCIFCFIDQLPKGMRETLYFKDDDARLSFLQGNYITLTNMTEREVSRVIEYHLSPINISVHTMNLELRQEMLKNKNSGRIVEYMDRLYNAGITMNGQIVLCKGVNDQEELEYTIAELGKYLPHLQSVSIVPVGLSKHRDGLYPLEAFIQEECKDVVETVERWQKHFLKEHKMHFIHCGDEFYVMAGLELPIEEQYDGYLQLENGVGMTRLLIDSFINRIEQLHHRVIKPRKITIATGRLIEATLRKLMQEFMHKIEGLEIQVIGITNNFFGECITISGLLTGQDIIEQLAHVDLGEKVYMPDNILRSGEAVLLDDTTLEQLKSSINKPLHLINYLGEELLDTILEDLNIEC